MTTDRPDNPQRPADELQEEPHGGRIPSAAGLQESPDDAQHPDVSPPLQSALDALKALRRVAAERSTFEEEDSVSADHHTAARQAQHAGDETANQSHVSVADTPLARFHPPPMKRDEYDAANMSPDTARALRETASMVETQKDQSLPIGGQNDPVPSEAATAQVDTTTAGGSEDGDDPGLRTNSKPDDRQEPAPASSLLLHDVISDAEAMQQPTDNGAHLLTDIVDDGPSDIPLDKSVFAGKQTDAPPAVATDTSPVPHSEDTSRDGIADTAARPKVATTTPAVAAAMIATSDPPSIRLDKNSKQHAAHGDDVEATPNVGTTVGDTVSTAATRRALRHNLFAGATMATAIATGMLATLLLFSTPAQIAAALSLPLDGQGLAIGLVRLHAVIAVAMAPLLAFAGARRDYFFPEAVTVFALPGLAAAVVVGAMAGGELTASPLALVYVGLLALQAVLWTGFAFKVTRAPYRAPAADPRQAEPTTLEPTVAGPAQASVRHNEPSGVTQPRPTGQSLSVVAGSTAPSVQKAAAPDRLHDVMAFVKECPKCGELIRRQADRCRHCGFTYSKELLEQERRSFEQHTQPTSKDQAGT